MNILPQHGFSQRNPREHLLEQLRQQLGRSAGALPTGAAVKFSSGAAVVDRLLPGGGLCHGILVEWLAEQPGSGAVTLSLLAAREACQTGGALVILDRRRMLYPPAVVAWGIDPEQLIVVHPCTARDELWAAVESLRSPAVAAVWAAPDRLDSRAFRRLQLAAEAGRTLGLLVRPASARGQPSWADVRLEIRAEPEDKQKRKAGECAGRPASLPCLPVSLSGSFRQVRVSVLRCQGARPSHAVLLAIDDAAHAVREMDANNHDTHPLPLAAELADPAAGTIPARA